MMLHQNHLYLLTIFGSQIPENIGKQKNINAPDTWRIYDLLPEQKAFSHIRVH